MRRPSQQNRDHVRAAAEAVAAGEVVGFWFNGAYALLGDADSLEAADAIFELKARPRSRTLSLVVDPRHWSRFVDLGSDALTRFPFDAVCALHRYLHALGVVLPADTGQAPPHLVQDRTILNVWTDYAPLVTLHDECRSRGLRALMGASANRSGEATYTDPADLVRQFGAGLAMVFEPDPGADARRANSVSLVDLTGAEPTMLRIGNTTETELQRAFAMLDLGEIVVPDTVRRL